ncbi:MAG: hypothetical protein U5R06_15965 [candidate division KSB1 bacterium]|nr:hypothetical protein [candidate division KSB1 bacterium]
MRILLLDQDKAHIRICRFLLKANSHHCKAVSTAEAAVLQLQQSNFDVFLSDADLFQNLQKEYPVVLQRSCTAIFLFTDLKTMPNSFRTLKHTFDIFPKPLNLTKMMYIQTSVKHAVCPRHSQSDAFDAKSARDMFHNNRN